MKGFQDITCLMLVIAGAISFWKGSYQEAQCLLVDVDCNEVP